MPSNADATAGLYRSTISLAASSTPCCHSESPMPFYDPEVNRTYGKMATHYNVGVVPARPRKPKDKAAVEAGVRLAQAYVWVACATSPSFPWPNATPQLSSPLSG
jgi:transposase